MIITCYICVTDLQLFYLSQNGSFSIYWLAPFNMINVNRNGLGPLHFNNINLVSCGGHAKASGIIFGLICQTLTNCLMLHMRIVNLPYRGKPWQIGNQLWICQSFTCHLLVASKLAIEAGLKFAKVYFTNCNLASDLPNIPSSLYTT